MPCHAKCKLMLSKYLPGQTSHIGFAHKGPVHKTSHIQLAFKLGFLSNRPDIPREIVPKVLINKTGKLSLPKNKNRANRANTLKKRRYLKPLNHKSGPKNK